jgi:predicted aspartyl protease
MGETCGMKLVYQTTQQPSKCKYCEKVDRKLRIREREVELITHCQREGRNPLSIHRSMELIKQLDAEISAIYSEISARRMGLQGPSQRQLKSASIQEGSIAKEEIEEASVRFIRKPARKVPRVQQRMGLPITFEKTSSRATIMAKPDSGSSVNAISVKLAVRLGLFIELSEDHLPMKVQTATGKWMSSCGYISTTCSVDIVGAEPSIYNTIIYVFRQLARPGLLFGNKFLDQSEVFARRLLRKTFGSFPIPCVRAVGRPTQLLSCSLNGRSVDVLPDTGSEADLISKKYAEKHFKLIQPAPKNTRVQYADGTIEEIFWIALAELAVGIEPPEYEGPLDNGELTAGPKSITDVS